MTRSCLSSPPSLAKTHSDELSSCRLPPVFSWANFTDVIFSAFILDILGFVTTCYCFNSILTWCEGVTAMAALPDSELLSQLRCATTDDVLQVARDGFAAPALTLLDLTHLTKTFADYRRHDENVLTDCHHHSPGCISDVWHHNHIRLLTCVPCIVCKSSSALLSMVLTQTSPAVSRHCEHCMHARHLKRLPTALPGTSALASR